MDREVIVVSTKRTHIGLRHTCEYGLSHMGSAYFKSDDIASKYYEFDQPDQEAH